MLNLWWQECFCDCTGINHTRMTECRFTPANLTSDRFLLEVSDAAPNIRSMVNQAGILDTVSERMANDNVAALVDCSRALWHLERIWPVLLEYLLEDLLQLFEEYVAQSRARHSDARECDGVRVAVARRSGAEAQIKINGVADYELLRVAV